VLPVIVGRREWIVGWNAVALLRTILLQFLMENGERPATGFKRVNHKPHVTSARSSKVCRHLR